MIDGKFLVGRDRRKEENALVLLDQNGKRKEKRRTGIQGCLMLQHSTTQELGMEDDKESKSIGEWDSDSQILPKCIHP